MTLQDRKKMPEQDKIHKRNLWVDYAKGIGIVLVVYGHVERGVYHAGLKINQSMYELVDSVIYSFHMPLFFFLSGYFLLASMSRRDSISLLHSKVASILYPYVIWSLLQGLAEVSLSQYVNGDPALGAVFSFAWSPRAQFWFLYVLFFVFALAVLVYRRSSQAWCTGIFIGSIFLNIFGWLLPDVYLVNMLGHNFVYFAAGVLATFLFAKPNVNEQRSSKIWGIKSEPGEIILRKWRGIRSEEIGTAWLAMAIALFIISQWTFHIAMGLRYDNSTASEKLLIALISISCVVLLALWLTRFNLRWLTYLGQNSMTIYLVHVLAASGGRIILQNVFGITDVGSHLLVGTLGGLLLPLLFYSGCERFGFGALFRPPPLLSIGSHR